jgi:DNA-directed RNA polymerase subunit RPC12/RpoP
MKGKEGIALYSIEENVECVKCGSKGAVQHFGNWHEKGLGKDAKEFPSLKGYQNKPFMSHAIGFGGTIPYKCLNCGNVGLIDVDGLEGYRLAFKTLK